MYLLCLPLSLLSQNLELKEGFVAAHTEMIFDKSIDPLNTNLEADVTMQGDDISSLHGKFWIKTKHFYSDNQARDTNMYDALKIDDYPLASYTLHKVRRSDGLNNFELEGNLNFFGRTQALSIQAEILLDKDKLTIKAMSEIKASDYGLEMPCMLLLCVQNKIDLYIKAVLLR